MDNQNILKTLKNKISGEFLLDNKVLVGYATDASVYSEKPMGVVIPKNIADIKTIVEFASQYHIPLIPRGAGTSLAGQVVGNGLVVDISKYLDSIIEINDNQKWVRVEPGIILDELNRSLSKRSLFFGPETSTGNRCTIGGMVGNNACGLHAVVYGTTRDHLLEASGFLSDGSYITFAPLTHEQFNEKCLLRTLEGKIYRNLKVILSSETNRKEIYDNYPDRRLIRRNNGYALDQLLETDPFTANGIPINVAKLIAGSEGTLLFITELKLNLVALPPAEVALVCAHFSSINQALKANIIALRHNVTAVELMDDIILNASNANIEQQKNRFFVKGDPKALLMIEFAESSRNELKLKIDRLTAELQTNDLGYHFPVLYGDETKKAWNLRKAGLGIMANIPGDKKSVTVIEDTAVHPELLPEYIDEFSHIMEQFGEECVYHAHAGTGEIHLRPRLDLKLKTDIDKFELLAWEIAKLVKKYKGSLSGEHGDGRLRGEFIPFMLGDAVYEMLKMIKNTWDPHHIFNPGKIIDTPPMREQLRYNFGSTREINTIFDFSDKMGIVRAAESCNGSGDCRKLHTAGGTMCPSFMATRDEQHVTRFRANVLREMLINSKKKNPFNHQEIYDAFDLCLSCKACKSECPSSVDVAKLKAEFLQHWYDSNGIPLRTRFIANIAILNQWGSLMPATANWIMKSAFTANLIKTGLGFAKQRSFPLLYKTTLTKWTNTQFNSLPKNSTGKSVLFFIDEFTNYNDTHIGIAAIRLLTRLGYSVKVIKHAPSGRTYISKGLLRKAKNIAIKNVNAFSPVVNSNMPLIGIEPSAILTFRDEYPDLLQGDLKNKALELAKNVFLIDEFIAHEFELGHIDRTLFTQEKMEILMHGHCQQKAIASTLTTIKMLSIPVNFSVKEIPTGCCGMAGSFGFEKEHYKVSMQIGELVLFPAVRNAAISTQIVAAGTSCRHQILDGTTKKALHPVEVLFNAML